MGKRYLAFYLLPFACLLGFIVGNWGPRADLQALRELDKNEKRAAAERKPDGFRTFARMVKIPEAAKHPRRRRQPRTEVPRSVIAVTNAPKAEVTAAAPEDPNTATSVPERLSPDDLRARIEEAQELWATRVEVARAQWKSKLGLSDDDEKTFDNALREMNEELYKRVSILAARLASEEKMTPELGFRLMGDTSTILAETYDKIGACVPQERRAEISEMQMIDFIDPTVAEPLIDVQDKLEGFSMRPGEPGTEGR